MRTALAVVAVGLSVLLVTAPTAARDCAAASRPAGGVTVEDVVAVETYARWACVLAGLSLAVAIWVGWSMRTLATNQVALAKLIEEAARAD